MKGKGEIMEVKCLTLDLAGSTTLATVLVVELASLPVLVLFGFACLFVF